MKNQLQRSCGWAVLAFILCSASAEAGSLGDYKRAKTGKKSADVTEESCPAEYTKDCQAKCAAGDQNCANACVAGAPQFCEERESRRTAKKWKIAAEAGSLAVGAVGMIFDDKMHEVSTDGTVPISPYAIYWNRSSFVFRTGAGMMKGSDSTYITNAQFAFRNGAWGLGGGVDFLRDTAKNDTVTEAEIGPSWSMGSANMLVTFQPSLVISHGNGTQTVYGFGIRSVNYFFMDQFYATFDPLLSHVNRNWSYDLKVNLGYRFTPGFFTEAGYFYKNAIDLNDLNITDAGLQGFLIRLGFRMN